MAQGTNPGPSRRRKVLRIQEHRKTTRTNTVAEWRHGFPARTTLPKLSSLKTFLRYCIYHAITMDKDLINLVNKLQDTFSNLGVSYSVLENVWNTNTCEGGELDMPQLVVVCV